MIGLGHVKTRMGQYGALWLTVFLLTGAAIGIGTWLADLIVVIDRVLPVSLALCGLGAGAGVIATMVSRETPATKILVALLAALLLLPLLWSGVSASVTAAFIADRSIEYSTVYAAFQIRVSEVIFPVASVLFGASFQAVWTLFQGVATVVGFISTVLTLWPRVQRLLGPEPQTGA